MPSVSPPVLGILRALVEERTGLHYPPSESDVLAQKLELRAQEAGFESLLDYYYYLRYDASSGPEMQALTDSLVVGETYFFREAEHLETVVSRSIQPLVDRGRRPRVWSAACATGEEPLSLAMLLAARGLLPFVDLVASDVSLAALARARRGEFGPRSVRGPLPPEAARHLRPGERGGYRVSPELVRSVSWLHVNLLDSDAARALGAFDAILCRNVLIYFSDETTRRVLGSLTDALAPGGLLFVGISESLLRFGTSLSCEEHGDVFAYRRGT